MTCVFAHFATVINRAESKLGIEEQCVDWALDINQSLSKLYFKGTSVNPVVYRSGGYDTNPNDNDIDIPLNQ